jgi:hypothetical protein
MLQLLFLHASPYECFMKHIVDVAAEIFYQVWNGVFSHCRCHTIWSDEAPHMGRSSPNSIDNKSIIRNKNSVTGQKDYRYSCILPAVTR